MSPCRIVVVLWVASMVMLALPESVHSRQTSAVSSTGPVPPKVSNLKAKAPSTKTPVGKAPAGKAGKAVADSIEKEAADYRAKVKAVSAKQKANGDILSKLYNQDPKAKEQLTKYNAECVLNLLYPKLQISPKSQTFCKTVETQYKQYTEIIKTIIRSAPKPNAKATEALRRKVSKQLADGKKSGHSHKKPQSTNPTTPARPGVPKAAANVNKKLETLLETQSSTTATSQTSMPFDPDRGMERWKEPDRDVYYLTYRFGPGYPQQSATIWRTEFGHLQRMLEDCLEFREVPAQPNRNDAQFVIDADAIEDIDCFPNFHRGGSYCEVHTIDEVPAPVYCLVSILQCMGFRPPTRGSNAKDHVEYRGGGFDLSGDSIPDPKLVLLPNKDQYDLDSILHPYVEDTPNPDAPGWFLKNPQNPDRVIMARVPQNQRHTGNEEMRGLSDWDLRSIRQIYCPPRGLAKSGKAGEVVAVP